MVTRSLLAAAAIVFLVIAAAPAQTTGEIPLSAPQYGPAAGNQTLPKVATNGSDFLVAWSDGRGIPGALYATRITRDGAILDPTGIRIDGSGSVRGVFRMAGAYTVVSTTTTAVQIATVGDDGQVIESSHVAVDHFDALTAAASRSKIVLASATELAVLDARGELIERFPLPLANASSALLASNGSTFLLLASAPPNEQLQYALDANGHPTASSAVGATSVGSGPLIASDGTDFVVVYNDIRSGITVTQRVAPTGMALATNALPVNSFELPTGSLTWTGSTYLLVTATHDAQQQLATVTLDRNGTFLGPLKPIATNGPATAPAAAWNGTHALVAWSRLAPESPSGSYDVDGALFNADGSAVSPQTTLAGSATAQASTVLATGGTTDLAAWFETDGIHATRLTRSGAAVGARGFLVAPLRQSSNALSGGYASRLLRTVFDGRAYIVAWSAELGSVLAQRIDAGTGAILGEPMRLATCTTDFDLGVDDAGPLLIGVDCDDRIFAQRVGVAGRVGAAVSISPADTPAGSPRMAWNGDEWLVVWGKLIYPPGGPPFPVVGGGIFAQRLSSSLALRDTAPIPVADVPGNGAGEIVASDGHDFVIVWSPYQDVLAARRVAADGTMSDTVAIASGTTPQSIVWDGARYAIAYRTDPTNGDLLLTHVRPDGGATGDRVVISATNTDERDASLVAPAGGPLRVVYTRVAPEAVYGGVPRAFAKDLATRVRRRASQ